jgi:hypothetical protein
VSLDVPSTATTGPVRANHLFQSVTGEGAALGLQRTATAIVNSIRFRSPCNFPALIHSGED